MLSVLALSAVSSAQFRPGTADEYAAKQEQGGVVLGAKPYYSDVLVEEAFGKKAKPQNYGILPVLVVITNNGTTPIKLENIHARYNPRSSREGVESMTAEDLFFFNPKGHQPKRRRLPIPTRSSVKVKKGPLARQEFSDREFAAPILPPGETASGFFYFNVGPIEDPLAGATVYVAGLFDMAAGRDLIFFEVPLDSE